jgi:hypothetical protein
LADAYGRVTDFHSAERVGLKSLALLTRLADASMSESSAASGQPDIQGALLLIIINIGLLLKSIQTFGNEKHETCRVAVHILWTLNFVLHLFFSFPLPVSIFCLPHHFPRRFPSLSPPVLSAVSMEELQQLQLQLARTQRNVAIACEMQHKLSQVCALLISERCNR